jgi:hypothetical protein
MIAAEEGRRGILDMVWHDELADVRVRFLGLPGRDDLFCEIALEPKAELKSVDIQLCCYPSAFTTQGARRIQTPDALIEQGKSAALPALENWWAVYYDERFDVAKGEGSGPCAMLLLPDQAEEVVFEPGSYGVGTTIKYPGAKHRLRLAFWDFKDKTNSEALTRLQDGAESVRSELERLDFTPEVVRTFNPDTGLKEAVAEAESSVAVGAALGDGVCEVRDWLKKYPTVLGDENTDGRIEYEERLLQSYEKLNSFPWRVKLAELLGEL